MLEKSKISDAKYENIVALFLLLVMGLIISYNLENTMDVLLWDEARYLDRGFWLWKAFPKTWGPIYSVWYKILSYIESNRLALYYLNYKILFILSTGLSYLFMITYRIPKFVTFFFCCMWLMHEYNLPSWPKISHFCICIILFAGIFAGHIRNTINKIIIFAIAFLVCAYARPEFYLSFVFVLFLLLIVGIKNIKSVNKINLIYFFVLIIGIGLSYSAYETPFNNEDAQRGIGVFLQHYAYNYYTWTHKDILWWFDVQEALDKSFKPPYNLKDIILNSDSYFWKHIFYNTKLFLSHTASIVLNLFLPLYHIKNIFLFILCSLTSIYIFWKYNLSYKNFWYALKSHLLIVFILVLGIIPSVVSSIYAYPRVHYLVLFFPLIFLLAGMSFRTDKKSNLKNILLFALLFVLFIPKAKDFKYFDLFGTDKDMMNKKTILYLEEKYNKDSVTIFDIDGQLNTLMTSNFQSLNIGDFISKPTYLLSDYIQNEQPDVVYITPTVFKLKRTATDSVFHKMTEQPEIFNYKRENIPELTDVYLLIKSN